MSLIQALVELLQHQWPLSAALEQVASTHPLPGKGEAPPQFVARRTLEDWYYAFKKGGFEGLKPKPRSDRGKPRRLSVAQQQWILEQVRSFPGVPVKLLYRQWLQADRTLPALSAVYRWLEQNDLDAQGRRYLLRSNQGVRMRPASMTSGWSTFLRGHSWRCTPRRWRRICA